MIISKDKMLLYYNENESNKIKLNNWRNKNEIYI